MGKSYNSTVTLRPSLLCWLARWIIPVGGSVWVLYMCQKDQAEWLQLPVIREALLGLGLLILLFAITDLINIGACLKWQITKEDLVIYRGIIFRKRNYTRLYRIVDFELLRSPLDLLISTSTIKIHSTDRTDPVLKIFGIRNGEKVMTILDNRVEQQRKEKQVRELTNTGYHSGIVE